MYGSGFAVAVNVEPDILLVDEVMAVGDEEFQRRCLKHMDMLRDKGTTHRVGLTQHQPDDRVSPSWLARPRQTGQGWRSRRCRLGLFSKGRLDRQTHCTPATTESILFGWH